MTDYLETTRDRLNGLHDHLSRREGALAADDLHAILSAILDHLEAEQASPEPDRDPECVKRWPECEPSAYNPACCRWPKSCSCNALPDPDPDPLDESNRADRIDCDGDRWVWCGECYGFRLDHAFHHGTHASGLSAAELDEAYGPLTFAPR